MRFEIKINEDLGREPVLVVFLFTRKEEYYLNGGEEGIYNCCSTLPDDKITLVSIIAQSVNACLMDYEKDMEDFFKNIIKKNTPKINEFMDMCGINQQEK